MNTFEFISIHNNFKNICVDRTKSYILTFFKTFYLPHSEPSLLQVQIFSPMW
jgi:hypothetical protein